MNTVTLRETTPSNGKPPSAPGRFDPTRCVESGIDIPTVARWLGHSDGGMLALKIYGHLRREHSQSMAARVTFGTASAAAGVNRMSV
jgi:hypothetical protein